MSPVLPWGITGSVIDHHFWSAEGGESLGDELGVVFSKAIGEHWEVITKGAWFIGSSAGPSDRWRFWLDVVFPW